VQRQVGNAGMLHSGARLSCPPWADGTAGSGAQILFGGALSIFTRDSTAVGSGSVDMHDFAGVIQQASSTVQTRLVHSLLVVLSAVQHLSSISSGVCCIGSCCQTHPCTVVPRIFP
jgi:hypothetical protein